MLETAIERLRCSLLECAIERARLELYGFCNCDENILKIFLELRDLENTTQIKNQGCLKEKDRIQIVLSNQQ